jgi:hypothetical protein
MPAKLPPNHKIVNAYVAFRNQILTIIHGHISLASILSKIQILSAAISCRYAMELAGKERQALTRVGPDKHSCDFQGE